MNWIKANWTSLSFYVVMAVEALVVALAYKYSWLNCDGATCSMIESVIGAQVMHHLSQDAKHSQVAANVLALATALGPKALAAIGSVTKTSTSRK